MMLSLLVSVLAAVQAAVALPDPRPASWIVDEAQVLSEADEAQLATAIRELREVSGIEVVVVTVDEVSGTPKAFTTELFHHWKLGTSERDDGVLVVLVKRQRRLEIETGDGLQLALPASWLSAMQQREMVPRFKRGEVGAGMIAGVGAIAARMAAPPAERDSTDPAGTYRSDGEVVARVAVTTPVTPVTPSETSTSSPSLESEGSAVTARAGNQRKWIVGLGVLGVAVLAIGIVVRGRSRCKKCGGPLILLGEDALSPGQRAEQRMRSVNHTQRECRRCGVIFHSWRHRLFNARDACSGCGFHTARYGSMVLRAPDSNEPGVKRLTTTCGHCDYSRACDVAIAASFLGGGASGTSSSSDSSFSSSSSFTDSSSSSSSNSLSSASCFIDTSSSSSTSSTSSFIDTSSSSSSDGGSSSGGGAGSSW